MRESMTVGAELKKLLDVLLALGCSSCMHRANVQYDAVARGGNDWVLVQIKSPSSQRMEAGSLSL